MDFKLFKLNKNYTVFKIDPKKSKNQQRNDPFAHLDKFEETGGGADEQQHSSQSHAIGSENQPPFAQTGFIGSILNGIFEKYRSKLTL